MQIQSTNMVSQSADRSISIVDLRLIKIRILTLDFTVSTAKKLSALHTDAYGLLIIRT